MASPWSWRFSLKTPLMFGSDNDASWATRLRGQSGTTSGHSSARWPAHNSRGSTAVPPVGKLKEYYAPRSGKGQRRSSSVPRRGREQQRQSRLLPEAGPFADARGSRRNGSLNRVGHPPQKLHVTTDIELPWKDDGRKSRSRSPEASGNSRARSVSPHPKPSPRSRNLTEGLKEDSRFKPGAVEESVLYPNELDLWRKSFAKVFLGKMADLKDYRERREGEEEDEEEVIRREEESRIARRHNISVAPARSSEEILRELMSSRKEQSEDHPYHAEQRSPVRGVRPPLTKPVESNSTTDITVSPQGSPDGKTAPHSALDRTAELMKIIEKLKTPQVRGGGSESNVTMRTTIPATPIYSHQLATS